MSTSEPVSVKPVPNPEPNSLRHLALEYVNGPLLGQLVGTGPNAPHTFAAMSDARQHARDNGLMWAGAKADEMRPCPMPMALLQRRDAVVTVNTILNNHNIPNLHVLARELDGVLSLLPLKSYNEHERAKTARRVLNILKKAL